MLSKVAHWKECICFRSKWIHEHYTDYLLLEKQISAISLNKNVFKTLAMFACIYKIFANQNSSQLLIIF